MQAKPSALYFKQIKAQALSPDLGQEQIMQVFDQLAESLTKPSLLPSWLGAKTLPKGVYLYGPVGRGKTFLMDLFYEAVGCAKKRQHFYAFMNFIHAELRLCQGERDPLRKVAQALAKETKLFCLDEFFVEDIADAMILSALLHYLFEAGVVLVTTSNIAPEALYSEGLQRERFLPAIDLVKKNMHVLELSGTEDYRYHVAGGAPSVILAHAGIQSNALLRLETPQGKRGLDWIPACARMTQNEARMIQSTEGMTRGEQRDLHAQFAHFNQDAACLPPEFELSGRAIKAVMRGPAVVWFDFAELCEQPRVAQDYLTLAQDYPVILIGCIPILKEADEEAARRFIALVDTFYDQKIRLIIEAAAPLQDLYQGERLQFEFERTKSRLFEMAKGQEE